MDRRDLLKYAGLWIAGSAFPQIGSATGFVFNQVGYLPAAGKVATLQNAGAAGQPFQVYSEHTGKSVFTGALSRPRADAAAGSEVVLADFSQLSTSGIYRLETGGVRSQLFAISDLAYKAPLRLAMRSFYGQRCGCAVNLGEGYEYPACHGQGAFHPTSGKHGSFANTGGWHDAGDYGRYVVNSCITLGTLLMGWELFPRALRSLSLDIPESGGKIPDYLSEVKWNLDWMLSLQDNNDGGVWHKQTSEHFCGFVMPDQDKLISYVIGTGSSPYKSTSATAGFAAVMAVAARCYAGHDHEFATRCLAAAKQAWTWAKAHPEVTFSNPPGITTGAYGDTHCSDQVLWASAELWRTTGEAEFEQAFLQKAAGLALEKEIVAPSWSNVTPLALWSYALAERKGDAGLRSRVIAQTEAAADFLADRANANGYGNTLANEDYGWGSNGVAANQSLLLLVASHMGAPARAQQAALGNLHYLLGRNCHGVSWVTQVGSNPFLHPHHRPSVASRLPAPWPGLLSGGPNAKPADKVAQALPKMPPMRMWVDDWNAYSMNEVAINWNAPLVFLLAAANS